MVEMKMMIFSFSFLDHRSVRMGGCGWTSHKNSVRRQLSQEIAMKSKII